MTETSKTAGTGEILAQHRAWIESGGAEGARAVFRDAALAGADLRGLDLSRVCFAGADLRGADLREAVLHLADFLGADLRDARLSAAVLRGADLRDAKLRGAKLDDAILENARLEDADLQGADLSGAKLAGASPRDPARLVAAGVDPAVAEAVRPGPVTGFETGRSAGATPAGAAPDPRQHAAAPDSDAFEADAASHQAADRVFRLQIEARLAELRGAAEGHALALRDLHEHLDQASERLRDSQAVAAGRSTAILALLLVLLLALGAYGLLRIGALEQAVDAIPAVQTE